MGKPSSTDRVEHFSRRPYVSRSTGGHRIGFVLTPLPPESTVLFVCEWPEYGIAESRVTVEGKLVLDAAARAKRLWPDDRRRPRI